MHDASPSEHLEETSGGISRRDFLRATGAASLALASGQAAC
ncbi:MAG: twin-arginine translocation signal domain-containing protein [Gemmatimonadetes bacterium]|nr:twin-arginine translocation signal domain-containing protein [Gemmatimonadota bacterium]